MIDYYSLTILVGLFLLLLLVGVPVAFAMLASGLLFAYTAPAGMPLVIPQRMINGVDAFILMAVPFFILVGQLMNTGGITRRLFDFATALVGHVRGGLAYVNILTSVIFAGMSGSAVADASGLGAVANRAMVDRGYPVSWSAALTAASSSIGPLIPPSIPFVIYASLTNLSVGKLLLAGALPGVALAVMLSAYVFIYARRATLPEQDTSRPDRAAVMRATAQALPVLMTPVILVGGIVTGYFTPTEAAAVGSLYSLFLGTVVYGELGRKQVWQAFRNTARLSAQILFMVAAAAYFGNALAVAQVPQAVFAAFAEIASTLHPAVALLLLNIALLVIGMFLDSTAILVILVPILAPLGAVLGIDEIQFAVIIVFNVMVGLITPPFGMVLFVIAEVSDASFGAICRALWPFIFTVLLGLALVCALPALSLALPDLFFGR